MPLQTGRPMPTLSARLPDPLPWPELARPLARAEDALARLDERLAKSPIREGWISRTHFTDAVACLWLDGQLVHLEDLVLHDAGMDVRAPTHELIRAHAVLGARRRIAGAKPSWALSTAGLGALRGRAGEANATRHDGEESEPVDGEDEAFQPPIAEDDEFSALLASVDGTIAHADKTLAGERRPAAPSVGERDPLVYDLDWNEEARLAEWSVIVDQTCDLPPTLAPAPLAVMESLVGEDLATLRARLGRVPWPRAVEIAARVAEILHAVISATGVAHRDLKATNVFLTEAGAIKLLDYGVAEFDAQSADRTRVESLEFGRQILTRNDADYQPPFPLTAKLDKLVIKVDRPRLSPAEEAKLRAAMLEKAKAE